MLVSVYVKNDLDMVIIHDYDKLTYEVVFNIANNVFVLFYSLISHSIFYSD